MAQVQDRIVKSKYLPNNTNVTWIDTSTKYPTIKVFINGKWIAMGEGGITIDETPIPTSTNPVSSGGVYTALNGKADKILVDTTQPSGGMLPNVVYNLGELSENTTFVLADATDTTIANIWAWTFSTGEIAPTITWPVGITMWSGGEAPTIEADTYYEITVLGGLAVVNSYTDSE